MADRSARSVLDDIYERQGVIITRLDEIAETGPIAATRVLVIDGLSDISERLGLIRVGELRVGTPNKDPGDGYTGLRLRHPAMTYDSESWHLAGVDSDVLQIGIRATDGTLRAGAGAVVLDRLGTRTYDSGDEVGRFGDLNGFLGYVSSTYGLALGDADEFLKYDQTNGLRIKGVLVVSRNHPLGYSVWDEDIDGPNGTTTVFETAQTFAPGTLQPLLNGIWLDAGTDYTEGSADAFTLVVAPLTGDTIRINYAKQSDNTFVYNETPSGTINGTNKIFTAANNFKAGTLQIVINGVMMDRTTDYIEGPGSFTMTNAPLTGDILTVAYQTDLDDNYVYQETPSGTIDGANAVFTAANAYSSGTIYVFLNGVKQILTAEYTESASTTITFVAAPLTGDTVLVSYRKA